MTLKFQFDLYSSQLVHEYIRYFVCSVFQDIPSKLLHIHAEITTFNLLSPHFTCSDSAFLTNPSHFFVHTNCNTKGLLLWPCYWCWLLVQNIIIDFRQFVLSNSSKMCMPMPTPPILIMLYLTTNIVYTKSILTPPILIKLCFALYNGNM